MTSNLDDIDGRIARLAEQQREMHAQSMAELTEMKIIGQQQLQEAREQKESIQILAQSAKEQHESIKSLAQAFFEQARAYREFSRGLPDVVEASRRAAQASEGAAFMAQRTLEAMRNLIEELRDQRNR